MASNFGTGTCKKEISGLTLSLCTKHKGNLIDFVELTQQGSVECRIDYSWEAGYPDTWDELGMPEQFYIDAIIPMNNVTFKTEDGGNEYVLIVNRGECLSYMYSHDGLEKLEDEVVKMLKEEADAI